MSQKLTTHDTNYLAVPKFCSITNNEWTLIFTKITFDGHRNVTVLSEMANITNKRQQKIKALLR